MTDIDEQKEYTIPSEVLDIPQKETDRQAEFGYEPGFLDYAQALTEAFALVDIDK